MSDQAAIVEPVQADAAEQPLGQRFRSGVGWTGGAAVLTHLLGLVRTIVMARLLTKDDFGLFGMALTVTGALSVLTNLGLHGAVIANKYDSEEELHTQLNTIWTAELARRVVLTLLLLASAYPTALFYREPRLMPILLVLCVTPLLDGLGNIGMILYGKGVKVSKPVIMGQLSSFLTTGIAILLGWLTRSVWALVWSQVIGSFIVVTLSYLFHPYRPRLQFDRKAFDRAFGFGKAMFVIGVMVYITTTLDNIVVGRLLGPGVLGVYVVAYSLGNLPAKVVESVLSGLLFPAYAEVLHRGDGDLPRVFERVFTVGVVLLTAVTLPLALLAQDIVKVAYGPKWEAAGPILRILVVVGLVRSIIHLFSPLLSAANKPHLDARCKTVEAVLFAAAVGPATAHWGAMGAASTGAGVYSVGLVLRGRYALATVPGSAKPLLSTAARVGLAAAASVTATWLLLPFVRGDAWRLLVGTGAATVTFIAGACSISRPLRDLFGELAAGVRGMAAHATAPLTARR